MTLTDHSPWDVIKRPENGFNVVRVDPSHPHAYFWGKNSKGEFLLLLEINKDLSIFFEDKLVELRGVKSDLTYHAETSKFYFILCLQGEEYAGVFYRLCLDLVDSTKMNNNLKAALEIIQKRLTKWRLFLSGKIKKLLSDKEVRGLYAELTFMYDYLTTKDKRLAILHGWQGPLNGPHDFVLGDYAVEIKSVSGTQKDIVRISSENQMFSNLDQLFLKIFFLTEFQDCQKGESLNQIVDKIREVINDSDHIGIFENRLYSSGYIDLKEYDSPCFLVNLIKTFEVRDDFPRIIPSSLPNGLLNVSYDLSLNNLEGYLCEIPLMKE